MKTTWRLALAAMVLALAGCASTLDAGVKAGIKTIALEPVKLADKPGVATPGAGVVALATGFVGAVAQQAIAGDVRTAYQAIVQQHVDVAAEIHRAARRELEQRGYRVVEPGQPSDARLTIAGSYALALVSLTGQERGAGTMLGADLVSGNGRKLWTGMAYGHKADERFKSKIKVAPYEQWFKDGALVAEQHKLVAEMVTVELLKGL